MQRRVLKRVKVYKGLHIKVCALSKYGKYTMLEDSLKFLACPICHGRLDVEVNVIMGDDVIEGLLRCLSCGRVYRIRDGIADFLTHEILNEVDREVMFAYDKTALKYDILMTYVFPLLSLGIEPFERFMWVRELGLRRGSVVLDVATGTGRNLGFLARVVGKGGLIFGLDISWNALLVAKRRARSLGNVVLMRCNASYLPFRDEVFDGVMHVGGINTFGEKSRALNEMVRVAKHGGRIVIVDEGLKPSKRNTLVGRFLLRLNALYASLPPVKELPKGTTNLKVVWKVVPFFPYYVMVFQKR